MKKLREQLKYFMAEHGLSVEEIAKRIDKDPGTIRNFLKNQTKPHIQTEYRIRALLENRERINGR